MSFRDEMGFTCVWGSKKKHMLIFCACWMSNWLNSVVVSKIEYDETWKRSDGIWTCRGLTWKSSSRSLYLHKSKYLIIRTTSVWMSWHVRPTWKRPVIPWGEFQVPAARISSTLPWDWSPEVYIEVVWAPWHFSKLKGCLSNKTEKGEDPSRGKSFLINKSPNVRFPESWWYPIHSMSGFSLK